MKTAEEWNNLWCECTDISPERLFTECQNEAYSEGKQSGLLEGEEKGRAKGIEKSCHVLYDLVSVHDMDEQELTDAVKRALYLSENIELELTDKKGKTE